MRTFKTVIIDDERLAREEVKRALKSIQNLLSLAKRIM
jgi:hypothetical protein